jgi:hypothetical protein
MQPGQADGLGTMADAAMDKSLLVLFFSARAQSRPGGDPTAIACAPVLTGIKPAPLRCSAITAGRPAQRASRSPGRLSGRTLRKEQERKILLFLKKKKQKDFCSYAEFG